MDMSGDFRDFALSFTRVYSLRRGSFLYRKKIPLLTASMPEAIRWKAFRDRKDAKRQTMEFTTWSILSKRKRRKYEPFF